MGVVDELLAKLVQAIGAERALIAQPSFPLAAPVGEPPEGRLVATARVGFEDLPLEDLPLSLAMLRQVHREGVPLLMLDAREDILYRDRLSVLISQIRTVICVPFWGPIEARAQKGKVISEGVAGIIYADCCSSSTVFKRRELDLAHGLARQLEQELFGIQRAQEPAPVKKALDPKFAPRAPAARANPPKVASVPARLARARPAGKALLIFYRCLAVMVGSGLTLSRSLAVLGQHSEDQAMREICVALEERLIVGSSLSSAMALFPGAFKDGNIKLIRVGETGGSLHFILGRIAYHEEKLQASAGKLLSSLTYPAIVLALTLLMLLVVPPFVLEGQFRLIRESGVEPPLPTRVLMIFSTALGYPLTWAALAAALAALAWLARRAWKQPRLQRIIYGRLLEARVIGRLLKLMTTARFTHSLSLMQEVGIPLTEGLPLAAATSLNPLLESSIGRAVDALRAGESLADSLSLLSLLSGSAIETVRAGEAAGNLAKMLVWCSRICEEEVDLALDTFMSLMEPMLMLVMGTAVGGMLLATLLPMVTLLQTL